MWAVGLMTGTVLDGMIDIAAVRTDGENIHELGPWTLSPYSQELRTLLSDAMQAARAWRFEGAEPAVFHEAEQALTRAQAEAVKAFVATHKMPAAKSRSSAFTVRQFCIDPRSADSTATRDSWAMANGWRAKQESTSPTTFAPPICAPEDKALRLRRSITPPC